MSEETPAPEIKPKKRKKRIGKPVEPSPETTAKPQEVNPVHPDIPVSVPNPQDIKPSAVPQSPIWKLNPDGTKERLDKLPPIPPTNPVVMWRADELMRFGYTQDQALAQILEEIESGELDTSPPPANSRNAPEIQTPSESPSQKEADNHVRFNDAYYRYMLAAVRLESGQVNNLPLNELEDIAMLVTRPIKSFPLWMKAVGINVDE